MIFDKTDINLLLDINGCEALHKVYYYSMLCNNKINVFDYDLYCNLLDDIKSKLNNKFKLLRFLRTENIIEKLRKFINNYYFRHSSYNYHIYATISIYKDKYYSTYNINIYHITKYGPYSFY